MKTTIRGWAIATAAVGAFVLAGCSQQTPPPPAAPPTAANPAPATTSEAVVVTPAAPMTGDATYLAAIHANVQFAGGDQAAITMGHVSVCDPLTAGKTAADVTTSLAAGGIGFSPTEATVIAQAAVKAYCPDQASKLH